MEKIIRLSFVLGLGLITSLSYGQEQKKEETVPAKKPTVMKEKEMSNVKHAEATQEKQEAVKAAEQNQEMKKHSVIENETEKVQTPQKVEAETPQKMEGVKKAETDAPLKSKANTEPVKPVKAPVSEKPAVTPAPAPEKKAPPAEY